MIDAGENVLEENITMYTAPTTITFDGTYLYVTTPGNDKVQRMFSGTGYGP